MFLLFLIITPIFADYPITSILTDGKTNNYFISVYDVSNNNSSIYICDRNEQTYVGSINEYIISIAMANTLDILLLSKKGDVYSMSILYPTKQILSGYNNVISMQGGDKIIYFLLNDFTIKKVYLP